MGGIGMGKDFLDSVAQRRSYYAISKESVVPDEKLQDIIDKVVTHTPSAFNSQSTRVVLLLGKQHDRLWDIAKEALRAVVPQDQFAATEEKINSFKNGYATVLYFEDQQVVQGLIDSYPAYAGNFPVWSQQTAGMHQFVIWTALEAEGFGASLQHYNELIADAVAKEWDLPSHWKLNAQMPFGKPVAEPAEKNYQPLEGRVKIFK
jgi:predicted oxidoreductase (fatty acid repression mutant protein)